MQLGGQTAGWRESTSYMEWKNRLGAASTGPGPNARCFRRPNGSAVLSCLSDVAYVCLGWRQQQQCRDMMAPADIIMSLRRRCWRRRLTSTRPGTHISSAFGRFSRPSHSHPPSLPYADDLSLIACLAVFCCLSAQLRLLLPIRNTFLQSSASTTISEVGVRRDAS